jgi:acyl carrier protein
MNPTYAENSPLPPPPDRREQTPDTATPAVGGPDDLRSWLTARLAQSLGCGVEEIDPHLSFPRMGLDSLRAFSITGDLAQRLQRDLSPTLLWEFPTVHELACYLDSKRSAEDG